MKTRWWLALMGTTVAVGVAAIAVVAQQSPANDAPIASSPATPGGATTTRPVAVDGVSLPYDWKPVTIVGGGFVSHLVIPVGAGDVRYAATDVGGAYRWDAATQRWQQLLTDSSVPASLLSEYDNSRSSRGDLVAVDAIAVSPSNAAQVVLAVGGGDNGVILRSDDSGATWRASKNRFKVVLGGPLRTINQRLAFDPAESSVVYYASMFDGLQRSSDGGTNWTAVGNLPRGIALNRPGAPTVAPDQANDSQLLAIVPDPSGPLTEAGLTARWYASVPGVGVFRSDDGATTWTNLSTLPNAGEPSALAHDLRVHRGSLFVGYDPYNAFDMIEQCTNGVCNDVAQVRRQGFRRYRPDDNISGSGRWTDLTPTTFRDDRNYPSVAIDPTSPSGNERIWIADDGMPSTPGREFGGFQRSDDGGRTWVSLVRTMTADQSPWHLDTTGTEFIPIGEMVVDPMAPDRLYLAEGYGIWRADDAGDEPDDGTVDVTFELDSAGIEEMVSSDLITPPGGDPISAFADQAGFVHGDLDRAPDKVIVSDQHIWNSALAYAGQEPQFVVASAQGWSANDISHASWSNDYGKPGTWTRFRSIPDSRDTGTSDEQGPLLGATRFGRIVPAAKDTNNLVWLGCSGAPIMFSNDRGDSWNAAAFFADRTPNQLGCRGFFDRATNLTADRVDDRTFYVYDRDRGAIVRSTDGGATWTAPPSSIPQNQLWFLSELKATPDHAGHLWLATGSTVDGVTNAAGLYRSVDGGQSVTAVDNVIEGWSVDLGKPAPDATYPTIFVQGRIRYADGTVRTGVHRSINEGVTWNYLGDNQLGLIGSTKGIAADMNVFGRVYILHSGTSIVYGDPAQGG
jgi:hypothetical protein